MGKLFKIFFWNKVKNVRPMSCQKGPFVIQPVAWVDLRHWIQNHLFKMSGFRCIRLVKTVFGLSAKIQPKQLNIQLESTKITHIQYVTSEQCGLATPKPSKMPCDSTNVAVRHEYNLKQFYNDCTFLYILINGETFFLYFIMQRTS